MAYPCLSWQHQQTPRAFWEGPVSLGGNGVALIKPIKHIYEIFKQWQSYCLICQRKHRHWHDQLLHSGIEYLGKYPRNQCEDVDFHCLDDMGQLLIFFFCKYYRLVGICLAITIDWKYQRKRTASPLRCRLRNLKGTAELFHQTRLSLGRQTEYFAAWQQKDGKHIFWLIRSKRLELCTFPFFN